MSDPLSDPLLDQALEWQMRLHSGSTAAAAERSAYAAWKLADPRNRAAAAAAEQLWRDIGFAAQAPAQPVPARQNAQRRWMIAACIAATAIGSVIGIDQRDALLSDHHTGYQQRQTIALSDGSTLELDANTAVDVDFTASRRRVTVRRGQIHVHVARDAARPFDVAANDGAIRALGTAFNVRRDDDRVDVAVTEHVVRVTHAGSTQAVDVPEGEHLRYTGSGAFSAPAPADLHAVTAWRRGYLAFDGAPLADVVAQLGHYRRGLVLIRTPALKQLQLTGVFKTDDTDALLDALPQSLPVRLRRLPGVVVIEAAHD